MNSGLSQSLNHPASLHSQNVLLEEALYGFNWASHLKFVGFFSFAGRGSHSLLVALNILFRLATMIFGMCQGLLFQKKCQGSWRWMRSISLCLSLSGVVWMAFDLLTLVFCVSCAGLRWHVVIATIASCRPVFSAPLTSTFTSCRRGGCCLDADGKVYLGGCVATEMVVRWDIMSEWVNDQVVLLAEWHEDMIICVFLSLSRGIHVTNP